MMRDHRISDVLVAMYSLQLTCSAAEVDELSVDLWEAGTLGIHELGNGAAVTLIATFETNADRAALQARFTAHSPEWSPMPATDWAEATRQAWPGRIVGKKLFLAAPWCAGPTPGGRERIIHNPGLACGTGEHPCTQLALEALEDNLRSGERIADIGTGSGILAIAALRLGAREALAVDPDEAALAAARENFLLNEVAPHLAAGSADCLATACADLVVANINASVLLAIADDLERIVKPQGTIILTGFPEPEASLLQNFFPQGEMRAREEWRCLVIPLS